MFVCSQAHWSCGCSSSARQFSQEGKTGSSCGNPTPFLPWFLLFKNVGLKLDKEKVKWEIFGDVQTCKDVFKAAGVHLAIKARVQAKPHVLQVLDKLGLRPIIPFKVMMKAVTAQTTRRLFVSRWTLSHSLHGSVTFGVQESKQLLAHRSVGHGFLEEGVLLSQLLGGEALRRSGHPVIVVQQSQESSVGWSGKQSALIQVAKQSGIKNIRVNIGTLKHKRESEVQKRVLCWLSLFTGKKRGHSERRSGNLPPEPEGQSSAGRRKLCLSPECKVFQRQLWFLHLWYSHYLQNVTSTCTASLPKTDLNPFMTTGFKQIMESW